jgi:hypothetical protein
MIDIKIATAKLLYDEFQISESVTEKLFEKGFIQENDAKKVLIRNEYNKNKCSKEKQRLRNKLAAKYFVSVSLVEKTVL